MHYSEHIMRLQVHWKWNLPPAWKVSNFHFHFPLFSKVIFNNGLVIYCYIAISQNVTNKTTADIYYLTQFLQYRNLG